MRIILSQKLKQMASALLVVMVLGGILCLFVMYYLSLVEQQNRLSVRSQAWNMAIAVTEAGIEEGLEALNSSTTPLASDGWSANGVVYGRTNTLPSGSWYTVSLDLTSPTAPGITARSYINLPAFAAAPSLTMFAVVGSSSTAPTSSTIVSRAVRVTCAKNPTILFTAAMVSKHAIDLKGNGVSTDSFDSSNPAKSTNGKYDASKYQGDYGDVATDDNVIVGVQNANIYGKLHTGPTGGYSMGPQGGVGTHAWQTANGGGMQPGYFLQNANFTFPDTTLPNTTGYLTPQSGDVVVTLHPITSNSTTTATCPTPLPWGGVATNIVSYTTNATYPSPAPAGLTTNTTWVNNSATQPSPAPAGTVTNITGYTTNSSPPSPAPAGMIVNTTWHTNSPSIPSPAPSGSSTNNHYVSNQSTAPDAGTYMPGTLVHQGNHWNYNKIDSYNYPTYTYSVPSSFTYNYPTYTYRYPNVWTYTYNLYQTNSICVTNHYDNVLYANTKYVSSALTGSSIVLGPNVTLVLPKGLTGAENLFFNYTDNINAGLTIYAGGTSASISGNQYINPCGFAGSLIVYCAPTVTSFTLNGNGQFTGVLVAPNADLAMHGGGNSDEDFCGALMVNSVGMNGHFKFHWDEALGRMNSNNNARYLVQTWNEIK